MFFHLTFKMLFISTNAILEKNDILCSIFIELVKKQIRVKNACLNFQDVVNSSWLTPVFAYFLMEYKSP